MDEIRSQLAQMKAALQLAEEDDKPSIQMIINQLKELVGGDEEDSGGGEPVAEEEDNDEYKLFQAEIAALSGGGGEDINQSEEQEKVTEQPSTSHSESKSIDEELEALIGMKCMAPHQESWGQIGYYSAMISSVLSLEGSGENGGDDKPSDLSAIMVRVIFIQPVVKSQLLCPFYKEDRCRFSDEDCKYSHGEVVPLAQLREYSEPDYTKIIPGSRVLAKYHDDLWYKATVHRITPDGECEISYDVGKESLTIPLHETNLLSEDNSDIDLSSDSSSSEDDVENPNLSDSSSGELDIPKTLLGSGAFNSSEELLDMKGTSTLGTWERYTKGIGSQLMLKMGYVMGTGLGRHREGRVEPVDAIVLPQGKSLDACMELKERAKDGNLFSAEKIRLKRQRKEQKQRERQAVQDKLKEKKAGSVFEFLNDKLSLRKCNENGKRDRENANKLVEQLSKQNRESLNKRALGIHENLRQVSKEIQKTKESMKRNKKGKDMETYGRMEKRLGELEDRKRHLDGLQSKVDCERKHRLDKRKLDLF